MTKTGNFTCFGKFFLNTSNPELSVDEDAWNHFYLSECFGYLDKVPEAIYNIVMPILLVLGAIGNILVMAYFLRVNVRDFKKMGSYHFVIINIAMADLLACLTVIIP